MARHVHCDQPMRDELADDGAPGVAVVVLADAEGGELVMAQPPDALVGFAQQLLAHLVADLQENPIPLMRRRAADSARDAQALPAESSPQDDPRPSDEA